MKDKSRKVFFEGIYEYADNLKLSSIKNNLNDIINDATSTELSYEEFLYLLLQKEFDVRQDEQRKSIIRIANFPQKMYLEDLNLNELPEDGMKNLSILKTLEFIDIGQNIILSANSGTGKTHMAIGLGINACLAGYKVFFATVPLFITKLKELRSAKSLRAFQGKLEKYDLVILDEFGYISSDREGQSYSLLILR